MTKDDSRLEQMCTNPLNKLGSAKENTLLGMEECRSPFGTYELKIPVDENLACDDPGIMNTNCKDLDVSFWGSCFFHSGSYSFRLCVFYYCNTAKYSFHFSTRPPLSDEKIWPWQWAPGRSQADQCRSIVPR